MSLSVGLRVFVGVGLFVCVCVCVCAEDDQEIILRDDSQKTNGPICLGISVASTKTRLMQSLLCTSGGGGGGRVVMCL